jgi:hypothetical protein
VWLMGDPAWVLHPLIEVGLQLPVVPPTWESAIQKMTPTRPQETVPWGLGGTQ